MPADPRPSRAVATKLKGGGFVMFSCTADYADRLEAEIDLAWVEKRETSIAELIQCAAKKLDGAPDGTP